MLADLAPAPSNLLSCNFIVDSEARSQIAGTKERGNPETRGRQGKTLLLFIGCHSNIFFFFPPAAEVHTCNIMDSNNDKAKAGERQGKATFFPAGIEEGGRTYPLPSFQSPSSIHLPIPIFCPETRWGGNLLGWREREIKHQMNIFLWGKSQAGITVAGKNIKNSDQETSQLTSKRLPTT